MPFHSPAASPRKAFTLIELLIVVAIIAILAAIAVPNFLEAQVRAKVSRAQADMRSLATAIESYRVDNTRYPPAVVDNVLAPAYAPANVRKTVIALLSTPISYMTSYPEDAFKGDYRGDDPASDPLQFRRLYDYRNTRFGPSTTATGNTLFQSATGLGIGVNEVFNSWIFYSPGPDREQNINTKRAGKNTVTVGGFGDPLSTWAIYDPTNGTVSWGDITRTRETGTGSLASR